MIGPCRFDSGPPHHFIFDIFAVLSEYTQKLIPIASPRAAEVAKDIIVAVLGTSVGLAGLLLVFVGFVYARADAFQTKRADRYRTLAKLGMIPFLISLLCAWFSFNWLIGDSSEYLGALLLFRASLITTALYGLVAMFYPIF
jgi:hypothetical protein